MFLSERIPVLFKKGALKLVEDAGEIRRVAEATMVIEPFRKEWAHELGEDIAVHLFEPDGRIAEAVEAVDLRVNAGLQRVFVRLHQDLDPHVELGEVSIKDVAAQRVEDKKTGKVWLAFQFVLVFSLAERRHRNFAIDHFGTPLYLSFERLQRTVFESDEAEARVKEAAARFAEAGGPDSSVTVTVAGHDPVTVTPEDAKRLRQEANDLRKKRTH